MEKQEQQVDGVLDSTFRADGPDVDEGAPGDETPEIPAPEGQPQRVAVSRREKARERDEKLLGEVRSMREASEKRDAEYREHLEAIRRENAELRGYVSARPQQQETRQALPDPDAIEREAVEALDRRDFATYQRKMREAGKADVMREIAPLLQQRQQQNQPQTNPMLMAVAAQYGDVMSDRKALKAAMMHDSNLGDDGVPEGPGRWRQAFEEARRSMKGNKPAGQQFSQRNREVVAGVPTNGSSPSRGGGGEPGVILTAEERQTAKRYRMTEQEYAKNLAEAHPERLIK